MYEAENDRTKPALDEQRLEELQETAVNAIQEHRPVRVTYFENKRFRHAVGYIERLFHWQVRFIYRPWAPAPDRHKGFQ